MPERREEDMEDPMLIPTKPLILSIPVDDQELKELREDLWTMGCAGLLARPWNVQAEDTLREFLYERGNQFHGLRRQNRTAGLRIRGLGFMESTEVLREDGQDVKMGYMPENSKERWIQRKDSTQLTA